MMARQDDEAVERLIASAMAEAADGSNKRKAAWLLFDAFRRIVLASSEADQIWGSEVCCNAWVTIYPLPDDGLDDDEADDAMPVH
jgi:hypothetical protein